MRHFTNMYQDNNNDRGQSSTSYATQKHVSLNKIYQEDFERFYYMLNVVYCLTYLFVGNSLVLQMVTVSILVPIQTIPGEK